MYLDSCYLAKFYLREPDSEQVRALVRQADRVQSSAWAVAELHAVLHRQFREGWLSSVEIREIASQFAEHSRAGLWNFIPVNEALLRRTGMLVIAARKDVFLRSGDAVHLATAQESGEHEVWTNDRHMLAAAPYFGLTGNSVTPRLK